MAVAVEQCDPVLKACLTARRPDEVEAALRAIVMGTVLPVARRSVRGAFGGGLVLRTTRLQRWGGHDQEDILAETVLQVLTRIHLLREGAAVMPIANLEAFVGASARNVIATMHRSRSPGRTLVAKRLDYHIGAMSDVDVQRGSDGQRIVVLRSSSCATECGSRNRSHARERIREHLQSAGGSLTHDELVRLVASEGSMPMGATLLTDLGVQADAEAGGVIDVKPDRDVIVREELRLLWDEITRLPLHQRRALLLGLEDISLLPISGAASLRQIAEAMEMPPEGLAALWRDLPMGDAGIAAALGTTEVRVRNFRKCARERLGRRMAANGLRPVVSRQGGRR